jgi:hypothetical protein
MNLEKELEELGELYSTGVWVVIGFLILYYTLGMSLEYAELHKT